MSKNLLNALNESLDSGELFQLVDDSFSTTGVLHKLGYSDKGQYVIIVRQFLIDNDICIKHFTSNGQPRVQKLEKVCVNCGDKFKCIPRKEGGQVTCSRACSNTFFRTKEEVSSYRISALRAYGPVCNRCGYDKHIAAIVVHHKDHNRENNDLSNLEVLCANCHTIHHYG